MTLRIFVFKRENGSLWADYSESYAQRMGKVVHTIVAETRGDMEAVIREPGEHLPDRVRALAERGLSEFLARNQQPEQQPVDYPRDTARAAPEATPRPWWRRLFG